VSSTIGCAGDAQASAVLAAVAAAFAELTGVETAALAMGAGDALEGGVSV